MKTTLPSIADLAERVQALEEHNASLLEALKLLLPMAITVAAANSDSAAALKDLNIGLRTATKGTERSEDFWLLAGAMATQLSSRAVVQHPDDPEVLDIHHGLRAHRRQ